MLENQLIIILIETLKIGFENQNIKCGVKQRYQPTREGAPFDPYVYFTFLFKEPIGLMGRKRVFNATTERFDLFETQNVASHYQINATAIQDPANTTQLTASDYVNLAANILNTQWAIYTLIKQNVAPERTKNRTQTFWTDDFKRFEANPIAHCSFIHKDVIQTSVPSTKTIVGKLLPV